VLERFFASLLIFIPWRFTASEIVNGFFLVPKLRGFEPKERAFDYLVRVVGSDLFCDVRSHALDRVEMQISNLLALEHIVRREHVAHFVTSIHQSLDRLPSVCRELEATSLIGFLLRFLFFAFLLFFL